MAGQAVHEVNDATFELEVLQSVEPVLVDLGPRGVALAAHWRRSWMRLRRSTKASSR